VDLVGGSGTTGYVDLYRHVSASGGRLLPFDVGRSRTAICFGFDRPPLPFNLDLDADTVCCDDSYLAGRRARNRSRATPYCNTLLVLTSAAHTSASEPDSRRKTCSTSTSSPCGGTSSLYRGTGFSCGLPSCLSSSEWARRCGYITARRRLAPSPPSIPAKKSQPPAHPPSRPLSHTFLAPPLHLLRSLRTSQSLPPFPSPVIPLFCSSHRFRTYSQF
jgi:hypothetical protein